MHKKKIVKHRREEYEIEEGGPVHQLVRSYLLEGAATEEEVEAYQYDILVYKMRNNRPERIVGRKFDSLTTLIDDVVQAYGPGRYKFFIRAMDQNGKRVGFTRIEDFPIADEEDDGQLPIVEEQAGVSMRENLLELQLKMMEQNQATMLELFKTMASTKSSGPGISQMLEILNTGIAIGAGKTPNLGEDGGDENGGMGALLKPLLPELLKRIISPAAEPSDTAPKAE